MTISRSLKKSVRTCLIAAALSLPALAICSPAYSYEAGPKNPRPAPGERRAGPAAPQPTGYVPDRVMQRLSPNEIQRLESDDMRFNQRYGAYDSRYGTYDSRYAPRRAESVYGAEPVRYNENDRYNRYQEERAYRDRRDNRNHRREVRERQSDRVRNEKIRNDRMRDERIRNDRMREERLREERRMNRDRSHLNRPYSEKRRETQQFVANNTVQPNTAVTTPADTRVNDMVRRDGMTTNPVNDPSGDTNRAAPGVGHNNVGTPNPTGTMPGDGMDNLPENRR